ncbi:sugar transferase [Microcoleus sp. Pol11C2]|uniref:sugar transferase n=1 Tax=Microcoleus sp. Pol11C2 TaxID=3055389 RepID=UPI002FD07DDE
MSFVGPRPLLLEYLERYSPQQARRHEAKPGIRGWAQINGRNVISREEKFNLDVWYFAHGSLLLDFKILLLTPIEVIKHRGISHPNQASMNEFSGNRKSNE